MAGPSLEEGEGALREWGAGVGVGVGSWGCMWVEVGGNQELGEEWRAGGRRLGRGYRRWGWVRGVDMRVVGQVSWWAIGRRQGAVGGALGLHHGLQALVALSRHVGAGGGHPRHVAGGRRGWGTVWQWWWLVHRGRVGRWRNLDFGEVTGIHRA